MNKKGFTLIELVVTIALLAIIVLIAVPAANTITEKSKKENCKTLRDSTIRAAELYVSDNRYNENWSTSITIGKDKYGSYLNSTIKNPCDNSEYNGNLTVTFQNDGGNIKAISNNVFSSFSCCSE